MSEKTETRFGAAAVAALCDGDMENFAIAGRPGGIEAQEAAGQKKLVGDQTLPKNCDRPAFEARATTTGGRR